MPGPPPVRDSERRRRNKPVVETTTVDIAELASQEVEIPAPDEDWHPAALQWYNSLARSGQSIYYEPSDWATAYAVAESLSRDLKPRPLVVGQGEEVTVEWVEQPLKGSSLTAYLKAFASLMVTESERRRLHMELERRKSDGQPAPVVPITQKRRGRLLNGTG